MKEPVRTYRGRPPIEGIKARRVTLDLYEEDEAAINKRLDAEEENSKRRPSIAWAIRCAIRNCQ